MDGDAELARVAALRALDLLDTPSEERFDRITRLAQHTFGVPIALVSLVELDRQWFKSCVGLDERESPRSASFCARAIERDDLMEIPDARLDPRFSDNPMVTGPPHIRFYAGQPISAPSGHSLGTLCVIGREPRHLTAAERDRLRDLAHWVELEVAVVQARQEANRAREVREELVSLVSHELRTPLTSIHGSLELVGSGRFGELGERAGRLVAIAAKNTDRLIRLSNDVLDLTRLQGGGLRLKVSDVDMAEVLESAVDSVEGAAERMGVAISRTGAASPVRGDADRLVQVFTNLLANAAAVAPEGTAITIAARDDHAWAEVSVLDRGPGVPAADLERIFEPFAQTGVPTGGAGLGLAITRGIVQAHGGTVRAAAAKGGGSAFTVRLPTAGPDTERAWW
ncbi:GAF domain-containing sensor histidine kinase [Amycolatopsis sp. OK19-0408]|uniref:histidine kinase n=1 Tax=Amycolatopsis iheyensis TaxID=2945988 RepID=A0A9X2SJV8_9PSEU|nr:GAF domain-containing sensor histidine kinase [Amycolatopsis iheyensis]MCR6484463.1 GAF domain-containing sensor histidine kinase [Amycolatopsis iheyensis]